ncbi:uncharacterized protein LOC110853923 isoform X1 [Folsomia candida]|uniref:uncharacterized protein LOC110853923 isoform X1 n=1 Tax=Folsomia candida TaxID=158441 RepID=UPI000B8FC77E|nr:uncharacterized protein LOC110853923 isoform X1 [Folsomia candida]
MTPTKWSTVLGITLLLVASTLGQTEKKNKALSDETPPGSAGHHGSVQSGQFLLTNNENYGLQISHTPYSSNPAEEEQLPKAQKLRQQQYQNAVPAGGETFCAGCTSLSNPQQDEQYYNNNAQQPQNAYAVPVQQKQQRYQRPQQVPYSTGHNSNIGNNAIQQQQPGYSYSVNLEGPSGGQRDSSWGWNSWNQQQQPQAQVRASQPMQQYQWGQRNPPNQQKQQVRSGWVPPQQHQQYHRELTAPAVQQHLRINDDGQYSFGYNAADSSRQEQRGLDGTVSGSYAYTDGTGQQVQVDYRASPEQGYQAFGPSIPNPAPVPQFQVPAVPQDTPEVQAARAQFFEAYNQQLKFIEDAKARAIEAQQTSASNKSDNVVAVHATGKDNKNTTTPSSSEDQDATTTNQPNKQFNSTDFKNLPEPIAIPDKNGVNPGPENQEDDELENDAVVIGREDEEPSSVPAAVKVPPKTVTPPNQQPNQDAPPQAGYSFSVLVGDQGGANYGGYNQNQWPQWGSQYQYQQQQPFTVGYQYPAPQEQNNPVAMAPPPAPVDSSYQFSHMVGVPQQQALGYHPQQQSQQQQQYQISVPNQANTVSGNTQSNTDQPPNHVGGDDKTRATQPGYFYYVSVGGSPHYMTSNNDAFTSKFPTSLKAHLAGSIPMDARHDPQVPHQNMGMVQNQVGTKPNPPVYVDMDTSPGYQGYTSSNNGAQKQQSVAIVGFIPGAFVSVRNGGFVSVNSAAVAQTGNGGGGTRVRFGNNPSNDQTGSNDGHQFPLLIFNNQNQ